MWFWVWLVLAAILIVAEIFTAGFFMLPFGIGAAVAAGLAFVDVPTIWQWGAFFAVSAVSLLGLRRFADHVTHDSPEGVGADRLIGLHGIVIEAVEPSDGRGRVRVQREEWRADSSEHTTIPKGARVTVERISGAHLVVRPADNPTTTEE